MITFDIKQITAVKGKQTFYQLTIDDFPAYNDEDDENQRNEKKKGVLDWYEEELEVKYQKDLHMIYAYMQRVANNQMVAGSKYHELSRPKSDQIKDFEFKHGDLRVYAFQAPGGKIIAVGGYKNRQNKDINRLRSLKQQYLDSLK